MAQQGSDERAVSPHQEQHEAVVQAGSSLLSDNSPTPTASLFLGQQQQHHQRLHAASGRAPSSPLTGTPPKQQQQPPNAGTTRGHHNVSALPMGSSSANTSGTAHTSIIPPQHASIPPPLASPAFAHAAALGRGRAPTLQSHPSGSITSGSPVGAKTSAGLPHRSVSHQHTSQTGSSHGHRSMPSTTASLAFSDAPGPSTGGAASNVPATAPGTGTGTGGNLTESESLFSGGEEDVYSQQYPARKGRPPALQQPSSYSVANRSGKSFGGGLRPTSAAGLKGKGRTRSRSHIRDGENSSADDDDRSSRPSRSSARKQDDPANVLPAEMRAALASASTGLDDDEVAHRDRGEELVRRRMRERKKEKKDAERRERKRRDDETRRDQDRQAARTQKHAASGGGPGTRESYLSTDGQPLPSYDDKRPPLSRRSSADPNALAPGGSTLSRSNTFSRDASLSATADGLSPYSPTGSHLDRHGFWPPPQTSSTLLSATPTPQSPFFPPQVQQQHQQPRRISYTASHGSFAPAGYQPSERDIFSEAEHGEETDHVPELLNKDTVNAAWRDEVARSAQQSHEGSEVGLDQGPSESQGGAMNEASSENEEVDEEDDEDEEDSNDDVEYTLKDRQDAINIEHPFGLPIWKPALYKKNRSVHRNADKELHNVPSFTAERHLLPGNLAWALLFGWWMAIISMTLACVMCLVPFGGIKYGRVIWELGTYLFWPFGKYVERTDEGSEDDMKGYDELTDDGEDTVYDEQRARDVEEAGKTWGRQSGRSTSSSGTIKKAQGRTDLQARFDEGLLPSSQQPAANETTQLLQGSSPTYGAIPSGTQLTPSGSETEVAEASPKQRPVDQSTDSSAPRQFRIRASGRLSYWLVFYLIVAPMMLVVCTVCWACVFTIPMAKLLWILVRDLSKEPLALHFRSPSPHYVGNNSEPDNGANGTGLPHLEAGQRAPRHSRRTYDKSRAMGRLLGPNSTIILCTYKAMGLKYYKYTIDGTNIVFINLLPLIAFVIFDFFVIFPWVQKHHLGGFFGFIAAQGTMFTLSLLSVIPLSYFIGMGVASISAQSSIGMGAVINATFGSIIEIILYSIALMQSKGQLVEGSIVGSLLAGVLLMPGLSMISGAVRRKEQRFNARSAGVTSTMLIMAIIGILTPTLFYEIYGTFQLTCGSCPPSEGNVPENFTCRRCFYEHVDPVDDEFYKTHVQGLSYYCAVLLVLVSHHILQTALYNMLTRKYSHTSSGCGFRSKHMHRRSGRISSTSPHPHRCTRQPWRS